MKLGVRAEPLDTAEPGKLRNTKHRQILLFTEKHDVCYKKYFTHEIKENRITVILAEYFGCIFSPVSVVCYICNFIYKVFSVCVYCLVLHFHKHILF